MKRRSALRITLLAACGLLLAAACTPSPVCAPTYTVTKTDDTNDAVCSASDCSLREAVDNANACAGAQTIQLPAGNYPLTLTGADEDANATGDLDITDDLTITGSGAPSISGEDHDRIFEVFSPATVQLDLLILVNGNAQLGGAVRNHGDLTINSSSIHDNVAAVPAGGVGASSGGGIFNEAGTLTLNGTQIFGNVADEGGGIHNFATATLVASDVLLQGNNANDMAGGLWNNFAANATLNNVELRENEAVNHGGGIYNDGRLESTWITFNQNVAGLNGGGLWNGPDGEAFLYDAWFTNNNGSTGGGLFNQGLVHLYRSGINNSTAFGGLGGGAYNDTAGALFMQNTTISANMIVAPPGLPGGSGVFNIGDMRLEFVTVAYNNVDGLRNDAGGTMTIRSSLLAAHSNGNCSGTTPSSPSLGYNLSDDASCGLLEASDMESTPTLIQFLASNGGIALSHMPNPGSPAIDTGDPDRCVAEDQRSVSRPQGAACDRGSIEVEDVTPPPAPAPVSPGLGTVTGALCYPSEGIPPMNLYFLETGSQLVTSFPHPGGSTSYSVDLDPGTYVAYAYPQGMTHGGSYSQAVLCGLTVNCTDHSLVPFQVVAGQVTGDIDICDWYGQQGDVPLPDGTYQTGPATVSGRVCYPSEGIPPMTLYFQNVNSAESESFPHLDGSLTYSHQIPPGRYIAYAYKNGSSIGGTYSQAVVCGLGVECPDHTLLEFDVHAGQETTDIDICDWGVDNIPVPPDGLPGDSTPTGHFTMNAFCRKGPGTEYGTAAAYEMGQEAELIGRSEPGRPLWWLTALRCWVSDSTVETRGLVAGLPTFPAPPTPVPATPPEPPARFRVSNFLCDPKQYQVTLSWVDRADNEDGYRLYRDGKLIATLGANVMTYVDNPPRGDDHTYALEAFNDGGASSQVTTADQGCQ